MRGNLQTEKIIRRKEFHRPQESPVFKHGHNNNKRTLALVIRTGFLHPARRICTTSTLALGIEQAIWRGFIRLVPTRSAPSGHACSIALMRAGGAPWSHAMCSLRYVVD